MNEDLKSRADKMLDDCLNKGLAFTESVSLCGDFVEDQIRVLQNLIQTSAGENYFMRLELSNLNEIKNYLLVKL